MKTMRFAAGAAVFAMIASGALFVGATPAAAAVYCKTVGYPKGCVARPAVHRSVVYCKTVGVPKGCVAR
jgi:hypothetical protein